MEIPELNEGKRNTRKNKKRNNKKYPYKKGGKQRTVELQHPNT